MNTGLLYIVLAEFFWAGELLLVRKFFPSANPLFLTAMTAVSAAVFYSPAIIAYKQKFTAAEWIMVALLGIFSFGIAQMLYVKGIQTGPSAFSIAIATLTLPLLSILMSLVFFKEPVTSKIIIGSILMVIGFLFIST
jgi:drug/metabolite transporter (DMT)-like permease